MQIDGHGTITASNTAIRLKIMNGDIMRSIYSHTCSCETADYIHSVVEAVEDFRLVKTNPI